MARPRDRVVRHIITNVVIDVLDEHSAKGICYALQYTGDVNDPAEKYGIRAHDRQFVGEFHDEFELTSSGWEFSKRSGRIIFTV